MESINSNGKIKLIKLRTRNLLKSLTTVDVHNLILYLDKVGFFVSPASTRFHGAYRGGLLVHSMGVYELFRRANEQYDLGLSADTVIICSFLHDLCKCGAYISPSSGRGYVWNKNHPSGHAKLSIARIKTLFPLTQIQEEIIHYHMGMYGAFYIGSWINEYTVSELVKVFSNNLASKIFYFCDESATLNEKLIESRGCLS